MIRLVIVGGGLAGGLAALALARRPDVNLMLVEQGESFGGNHIWSFFDTDVGEKDRRIIDPLIGSRWINHDIRFPARQRTIPLGYNSVESPALDSAVKSALGPARYRLGTPIAKLAIAELCLADGERIEADCVIDARGLALPPRGLELGWQKFVGRTYEFADGHGIARPVIMDATIEQLGGYRFLYFLPLDRSRLLIEDTYYSLDPTLDREAIGVRLEQAAGSIGGRHTVSGEEAGVLPVVLSGSFESMWPSGDIIPRLGVAGGFFHPTTSYSLPDAVANAALLATRQDLRPEALTALLRDRAQRLWNKRSFYRLLNRMLFHATEPGQSFRVLEHFYRLPDDVIARFYAGHLTAFDKLRILSGRPPVPIGRALSAIFGRIT